MCSIGSKSVLCYWDKHNFSGEKIQCPLKYNPKQIVHKKREYYIHENVCEETEASDIDVFKAINSEIVYTDMFCSNNCLLSWIDEMHYNPEYSQSKIIFTSEFYRKNKNCDLPKKAPHWRTLKVFGGFLTIDEFRQGNNIYTLSEVCYTNNQVTHVFDKKVNIE